MTKSVFSLYSIEQIAFTEVHWRVWLEKMKHRFHLCLKCTSLWNARLWLAFDRDYFV